MKSFKLLLYIISLLACNYLIGQDSLSTEDEFYNDVYRDSSSILSVVNQDLLSLFSRPLYVQNKGALQLSTTPTFYIESWYNPLLGIHLNYESTLIKSDSSYTVANYDYGFKDSHLFNLSYSDKIGLTYTNFLLKRQSSIGTVSNTDVKNLSVLFDFTKEEGKWQYSYGYYKNTNSIEENGGISDSVALAEAIEISIYSIPTYLNTAKNIIENQGAYFSNSYFFIGGSSSVIDSLDTIFSPPKISHGVGIDLFVDKNEYTYEMGQSDIDSSYYLNTLIDPTGTKDSIGFIKKKYDLSYQILDKTNRKILDFRFLNSFHDWSILNRSNVKLNAIIYGNSNSSLNLESEYTLSGLWKGAYETHITGEIKRKYWLLNLLLDYSSSLPSYFYIQYRGNHFQWNNNFQSVKTGSVKFRAYHTKYHVGVSLESRAISNYVYLDESSLPSQAGMNIVYSKASIYHSYQSKYLKIYTKGMFQAASSSLIRFPKFSINNTFAYCFKLGGLKAMTGFQATYFTSYFGMAYNPNLRQLYLQNSKLVGAFPILDLFASVKIGGADVFVKWENTLFNTISREFYLYPDYITVPRMIRIGLNWKFIN